MVQVNVAAVMGVLIIITGVVLVGVQVMESGGGEMQNHPIKLIGAQVGSSNFQVETALPGVPIIALGILLLILGAIFSH